MKLTLNILEHELSTLGRVVRSRHDNPSFLDFRLFIDSAPLTAPGVLYFCSTRKDVEKAVARGRDAIYVNTSDTQPDQRAVLSVLGGESILMVFNAVLDIVYRFSEWEHVMDTVRFEGGSLQELVDISSPFLMNNVVILDPALKLLAYTKDVPCDDPITAQLIAHGYHTEENISKFKLHKRFNPWAHEDGFIVNDSYEICKYVTVVRSFKTKSSFAMIVVMMCNVCEPSGYLLDVYDKFAERVAYYAERDYPDDKPSGNAVDTFLKDLFLNDLNDEQTVQARGRIAGIPSQAHFCLFYMREPEGALLRPRLLSDVSRLVAPAKTTLVDDAVVVLCFNCRSDKCALHCASNTCPMGHKSLSARLNDMMQRNGLICGRSSKFTRLADAPKAFEQARVAYHMGMIKALKKGALASEPRWDKIVSFDSCVVDYLVKSAANKRESLADWTYAGYVIDAISKQDARTKTDNYRFLYEYLMCERRASVVAERLHMHRNNVKYRIDKIESQYGIDTSDPVLRFDFLLAYRIREARIMQAAQ